MTNLKDLETLSRRLRRHYRMKPVVAVLVCFLLLPTLSSAQPGAVQKLAPGVYVWQGDRDKREPANCMWVIFKDYVLVVDANFPWAAREIIAKIKSTTDKPIRFVLNTHYHGDHSYGNSVFTDVGALIIELWKSTDG